MTDPTRVGAPRITIPAGVVAVEDWPDRLGESAAEAQHRHGRALERRRSIWWARVPVRFREALLTDLTADQGASAVSRWWSEDVLTLLLRSDKPGLGKTHAAYAVGNAAVDEHGAGALAWSMVALNDALRPGNDPEAYQAATTCDLLVLDDIGRERITEWTLERLQGLLDVRWTNRLRTVLTTNLTGVEFVARYGAAVGDRIRDDAWIVEFTGESRRAPAPW